MDIVHKNVDKPTGSEYINAYTKLSQVYAEIEQLRNQQDNTKTIHLHQEYQIHIDDLKLEAIRLRKIIRRKERNKPKQKGRLELPDFCFNHKKVAKSLEGMTW